MYTICICSYCWLGKICRLASIGSDWLKRFEASFRVLTNCLRTVPNGACILPRYWNHCLCKSKQDSSNILDQDWSHCPSWRPGGNYHQCSACVQKFVLFSCISVLFIKILTNENQNTFIRIIRAVQSIRFDKFTMLRLLRLYLILFFFTAWVCWFPHFLPICILKSAVIVFLAAVRIEMTRHQMDTLSCTLVCETCSFQCPYPAR